MSYAISKQMTFDLIGDFIMYADKKVDYNVKVKGVEISPYPIARGQPATFSIAAATGTLQFLSIPCVCCHYLHFRPFAACLCTRLYRNC